MYVCVCVCGCAMFLGTARVHSVLVLVRAGHDLMAVLSDIGFAVVLLVILMSVPACHLASDMT